MLVLNRKCGERIVIGTNIELTVVDVRGGRVTLGFAAPRHTPIRRKELENKRAGVRVADGDKPPLPGGQGIGLVHGPTSCCALTEDNLLPGRRSWAPEKPPIRDGRRR
jgi:carbon storage regulator